MKKEFVPVILAAIGLLADLIAIGTFVYSSTTQNNLNLEVTSSTIYIISHVTLFYSWIVGAWYLSLREYRMSLEKGQKQRSRPVIFQSTLSIGILVLPISVIFEYFLQQSFSGLFVLFFLLGVIVIYEGLKMLLVLVYPEMQRYFSRIGEYECKKTISFKNGIKIVKGKKIMVVKRADVEQLLYVLPTPLDILKNQGIFASGDTLQISNELGQIQCPASKNIQPF